MIFQEPMTSLSPLHTIGDQISESYLTHIADDQAEAKKHTPRRSGAGRLPRPEARPEDLSVRIVRRLAATGDDRDGADHQTCVVDRRRTDHRARRHDAGADPRPDQGASGRDRHVGAAHHSRSRGGGQRRGRGRGDLSWPRDGSRFARGFVPQARSILTSRRSCAPSHALPWPKANG